MWHYKHHEKCCGPKLVSFGLLLVGRKHQGKQFCCQIISQNSSKGIDLLSSFN